MRWALEISMPRGFMASIAAAENVEAGRIDANTAGRVAARRAVRANILMQVDEWVKEDELPQIDKVRGLDVIGQTLSLGCVYACKQCVSGHRASRLHTPTNYNDIRQHAWANREWHSASQAYNIHQEPPE